MTQKLMPLRPTRVVIKQFRSIRELTIALDPSCLVLLGINETGKTNILRALSLLSPTLPIVDDDVRQVPSGEPRVDESSVEFFFPIDLSAQGELIKDFASHVLGPTDMPVAAIDNATLTISSLITRCATELLYFIDVSKKIRRPRYWGLDRALNVSGPWVVATSSCPPEYQFAHATFGQIRPRNYHLIDSGQIPSDQPKHFFRPAKLQDITELYGTIVNEFVLRRLPECISWSFNNDQGLPATVNLDAFASRPESCPALRNMFNIAGVTDIAAAIVSARKPSNGVRSLLGRVGDRATDYIRTVWREFASLKVELHENGQLLECVIRDTHEAYSFARRSDGFRRFVSFLLQVAARMQAGTLEGAVLLYDEPDTSLHPSGARQLRDELLRLADKNIVVFSTHSIFMVDPDCLARHLIVKKQAEITSAERAHPAIVADEEVLYNAIGHSIFAVLAERNVLLEGYRDKMLIDCVVHSDTGLKSTFEAIGLCHAGGVRNVAKITPMLQLAGRSCLVVSDADKPALEARKGYEGHASWVTYAEMVGEEFVTAEDFLRREYVNAALGSLAGGLVPELTELVSNGLKAGIPVLFQISDALDLRGLTKERRKEATNALKNILFDNLRSEALRPEAKTLAEKIVERIGSRSGLRGV